MKRLLLFLPLLLLLGSCGNGGKGNSGEASGGGADTIALVEGTPIPESEIPAECRYYVADDKYATLFSYYNYFKSESNDHPDEDWIATFEPLYNALASENGIGPVAPTRDGARNLIKTIRHINNEIGHRDSDQSEINFYEAFFSAEEDFIDVYSMQCMKVAYHREPATYNAMTAMDDAFNAWADAHVKAYDAYNVANGLDDGSMYGEMLTGMHNFTYNLRPMTTFFSVLNDPDYEIPAADETDYLTLIPERYTTLATNTAGAKEALDNASTTFTAYMTATDAFIKALPAENQDGLRRVVAFKNKRLLDCLNEEF